MNKKIPIAIGIAVAVIAVVLVGAKAYLGDSKTELPAEEKIEKSLNIQEKNEGAESGENEANEAGEARESNP
jgi:hypothetical protein